MSRAILSLDNFKKWIEESEPNMSEQKENENSFDEDDFVGKEVQSKISLKKLLIKSQVNEGNEKEVCLDFFKNGGTIVDCEEDQYLIEVESGQLYLEKIYIEEI